MHDRELYSRLLGLTAPWSVSEIRLDMPKKQVEVFIVHSAPRESCPECGEECPKHDSLERKWRHLDTMQFVTLLVAKVPRIDCKEHGVRQVKVPWAEAQSRFTALFEALVIDWLKEASIAAVAGMLKMTWDQVDGVLARAVARGLARRQQYLPTMHGVDETSFQKRHEYVTVISDQITGAVVHVADGRGKDELEAFYRHFSLEERAAVDSIALDMSEAFISAVRACIPDADEKIAFDKFHVAKHLGDAVNKVRRGENAVLIGKGDRRLVKSKYLFLKNPTNWTDEQKRRFDGLRSSNLRTGRAFALKETAMSLWGYRSWYAAEKNWLRWYGWAIRSRIEPMKAVARMVKRHLDGILNAVVTGVTNARAEGINAVIQWVKYTARGFRNRARFRNAIYFHLGGLDLYPATLTR